MAEIKISEPVTFNLAELTLENPDNVRSLYVNHVEVLPGSWDFRLVFKEIIAAGIAQGDNKPRIELRANLVMSHSHAKAFSEVLKAVIENHEQQFGEIKWHQEVAKPGNGKAARAAKESGTGR